MADRLHAPDDAPDELTLEVQGVPSDATCTEFKRKLTKNCLSARRLASHLVSVACASAGGRSAFARVLGVSHTMVGKWCDSETPDTINLGDLIAGGRVGRDVLGAALGHMDDEAPPSSLSTERHARMLTAIDGELAAAIVDALQDDHWSDHEVAAVEKILVRMGDEVARALRDIRVGRHPGLAKSAGPVGVAARVARGGR